MKKFRALLAVLILGSALGYVAINALGASSQPTVAPNGLGKPS